MIKKALFCLLLISFLFVSSSSFEALSAPNSDVKVEWHFWREKVNPETGKGEVSKKYSLRDYMNDIIGIKNKGEVPITDVRVEFVTTLSGYSISPLPDWLASRVPHDVEREKRWRISLDPGEKIKFEDIKEYSEWVVHDFRTLGYEVVEMDKDLARLKTKGKIGPIKFNANVDLANSTGQTIAKLFVNGEYCGEKKNNFTIVPTV
jgi:hypothetical protein